MNELKNTISKRLKNILKTPTLIKFFNDNLFMKENLYRQTLLLEEISSSELKRKFIEEFELKGIKFEEENWNTDFEEDEIESEMDFFYKAVKDYAGIDLDNVKIVEKVQVIENSNISPQKTEKLYSYGKTNTTNDLKKDFEEIRKTYLFKTKPNYMPFWNRLLISAFLISGLVFSMILFIRLILGQSLDLSVFDKDPQNPDGSKWIKKTHVFMPGIWEYVWVALRIALLWFFVKMSLDTFKSMKQNENIKYGGDLRLLISLVFIGLWLLIWDGIIDFKKYSDVLEKLNVNADNFKNHDLQTYIGTIKILSIVSISTGGFILGISVVTYIIKPKIDLNKVMEINVLIQEKREQMMMENFNKMKEKQAKYSNDDEEKTTEN